MKTDIVGKNIELTDSIKVYVAEKLGGLDKFVERFNTEGAVEMWVTLERTTGHHYKGDVYQASADLSLPGTTLHAEETDEDMRAAIDAVKDKLYREIETYKGKLEN